MYLIESSIFFEGKSSSICRKWKTLRGLIFLLFCLDGIKIVLWCRAYLRNVNQKFCCLFVRLRKLLFVEKPDHYCKTDNWPPENERRSECKCWLSGFISSKCLLSIFIYLFIYLQCLFNALLPFSRKAKKCTYSYMNTMHLYITYIHSYIHT